MAKTRWDLRVDSDLSARVDVARGRLTRTAFVEVALEELLLSSDPLRGGVKASSVVPKSEPVDPPVVSGVVSPVVSSPAAGSPLWVVVLRQLEQRFGRRTDLASQARTYIRDGRVRVDGRVVEDATFVVSKTAEVVVA